MKVLVIKDDEDGSLVPQAGIWNADRIDYAKAVRAEWETRTYKRFKRCSLVKAELTELYEEKEIAET